MKAWKGFPKDIGCTGLLPVLPARAANVGDEGASLSAFVELSGLDHAEYVFLHPAEFAGRMRAFWESQGDSDEV